LVTPHKTHITFGVQTQHHLFETALTDHRHVDTVVPVHGTEALLVPVEPQHDLSHPRRGIQQSTQSRHSGGGHSPFEDDATINQTAWFYVCRYGSRHKRAILGTCRARVKAI